MQKAKISVAGEGWTGCVLLAASLFSLGTVAYLRALTGTTMYTFLAWDLLLAWVPWILSFGLRGLSGLRRTLPAMLALSVTGMLWLLFLPNAAYLTTELLHAPRYLAAQAGTRFWDDMAFWYSLTATLTAAWTGLLLMASSVWRVQRLIAGHWGQRVGAAFAGAVLALSALGVYIGRFVRWNSWDLIADPFRFGTELTALILRGDRFMGEFTVLMFAVELLVYLLYCSLIGARSGSGSG